MSQHAETSISRRRRALGLTVVELAYTARIARGRVSRPDGIALLRIEWVLGRLEDGWSLQQVRAVSEARRRQPSTVPAAVAEPSVSAGGDGGHCAIQN